MKTNTVNLSRRRFLKGTSQQPPALRPPWAQHEHFFLELCSRCSDCADACQEEILIKGDGGFPAVDFALGECTFCTACVTACQTGALQLEPIQPKQKRQPWQLKASINESCLTADNIQCFSCGDECAYDAIHFCHGIDGISRPTIDESVCTGCGACFRMCPAQSIRLADPLTDHSAATDSEIAHASR